MYVPHVLVIPLFSRPKAGLATIVGARNVLNARKQQQHET